MPTINVEYTIDTQAGAERLWDILVKSWQEWHRTPHIEPVPNSPLTDGSTFAAQLGGLVWNITVTKADRPNKLSWSGQRMGLNAIHEWEFLEEGSKTRAVNKESISGWMLFFIYPIAKVRVSKSNEKWLDDHKANLKLKRKAFECDNRKKNISLLTIIPLLST